MLHNLYVGFREVHTVWHFLCAYSTYCGAVAFCYMDALKAEYEVLGVKNTVKILWLIPQIPMAPYVQLDTK